MWPDHRLQQLFGIELPILQAPMAGSSSAEMALAVSAAGGLGSLACATLDAEGLRAALAAMRQKSTGPLNVNFFARVSPGSDDAADEVWLRKLSRYYRELGATAPPALSTGSVRAFDAASCAVIEAFPPAVVSFHFGLPETSLLQRVRATGAKIISSATTVEEACSLEEAGCDAIIAQGYEAGGHRGMFLSDDVQAQVGTFALVPQIADAVRVPVVAAGGIADGRGIAAAFALGASGVQLGTAFLFAEEASIDALYRDALGAAPSRPTVLTNVFSGRPARCMVNRLVSEVGPLAAEPPRFPKGFSALAPLRAEAERQGAADFSAHYCGQAAALGRATTAAALMRDLVAGTERQLQRLAGPPR